MLHLWGAVGGLPGCAPFCVKTFWGAARVHLWGAVGLSPAAPHFALSQSAAAAAAQPPQHQGRAGRLSGGPGRRWGEPVPCVARHRFWAVWSLASGYVPRSGLWRTGLSSRHGASWALRAVQQWAGRAAHIPAGTGDATTARHQRRGGAGRTACSVKLIRLKSVWHCIVGACASRLQCCALSGLAALPRGELRKDCWECRSRRQMGTALV